MNNYLVDTHVLIDFFKKKKEAQDLIIDIAQKEKPSVSILAVTELRAGWTQAESAVFLGHFYKLFLVEPINLKIAELAGKLLFDYKRKGINLASVDALIAATALYRDLIIVTRDRLLTSIKVLKIYDF